MAFEKADIVVVHLRTNVAASNRVAVTYTSDITPVSRK